jgi:hypothetical protein
MKNLLLFLLCFYLASCSTLNKVIVTNDVFKDTKSISLNQQVKSVSDLSGSWVFTRIEYPVFIRWFGAINAENSAELILTMGVETSVRRDPLNSDIYLQTENKIYHLSPIASRMENFENLESTTSLTTATVAQTEVKDGKTENSQETVTRAKTTNSLESLRYSQYKYVIDRNIVEDLAKSNNLKIRFYLGDEGCTTKMTYREKRVIKRLAKDYINL